MYSMKCKQTVKQYKYIDTYIKECSGPLVLAVISRTCPPDIILDFHLGNIV